MTIVAAWLSELGTGKRFLECVADSQVSLDDGRGILPLLNTSAKIFPISIIVRHPGTSGNFDTIHHLHSLGIAFSGSSLIGLNLASTLSALTSQLNGTNPTVIPALTDIACLAMRITSKYVQYLGNAQNGVPLFQAAVLGWCHVTGSYQLIRFGPASRDNPVIVSEHFDLNPIGTVFLMGNHTSDIQRDIETYRSGLDGIAWDNAPKIVIENIIRNNRYESIGGGFQRGRGFSNGFFLYAVGQPIVEGEPAADILFRGLSLSNDIGAVGPCFVGMMGSF